MVWHSANAKKTQEGKKNVSTRGSGEASSFQYLLARTQELVHEGVGLFVNVQINFAQKWEDRHTDPLKNHYNFHFQLPYYQNKCLMKWELVVSLLVSKQHLKAIWCIYTYMFQSQCLCLFYKENYIEWHFYL